MNKIAATDPCPCGQPQDLQSCCEPIHRTGAGLGISAEALMRARYSAYVVKNEKFLLDSWHPDTRPAEVSFVPGLQWTGLKIHDVIDGGGLDSEGTVEFTAHFETTKGPSTLRELSSFIRQGGNWFYVSGDLQGPGQRT